MKRIQQISIVVLALVMASVANLAMAQCGTFKDTPKENDALELHVLYRDQVKLKNFDAAYEPWKQVFEMAPAADGKRASHYSDGRAILKHKMASADEAGKKDLIAQVLGLYDKQMVCYGEKGEKARLQGRKAFDMFYEFRSDYQEINALLKESVEGAGDNSEYIVFVPYASVVEYLFTNEMMQAVEARTIYAKLNSIADNNANGDGKYKAEYKQAQDAMNAVFNRIEEYIFDCAYFMDKLMPEYQNDKDNPEVIKRVYNKLVSKGCDKSDPLLQELKVKYETYAAQENARRQSEFESNNPSMMARKAYEAGDFNGALTKYQEALGQETDSNKKANIIFSMASIKGRKLNQYSAARELARKAASLKPGWGRPYMLIGDLYAKGSRDCGDSYEQRLAILAAVDKYSYAKSIDGEVASEASKRISSYRKNFPDKETAFMKGHKEGTSVKVGCWIGETVKVRF